MRSSMVRRGGRSGGISVSAITRGRIGQQLVRPPVLQPVANLSVDPVRVRCARGEHHNQIAGPVHRLGDLAPQVGIGGHVGGIPKDPQRVQLGYPATDVVQSFLDSGGNRLILVVIGQKGVVSERRQYPQWVSRQRVKCAKGTFDPDRQMRLQDLPGWTWNARST